MSGLNMWTRAILRFANWIAGEQSSEWCAAMAAETDAAGSQGMGWALGCIGAALRMRLRTDWKRMAILIIAPFAAYLISMPWFFLVTWSMDASSAPVAWAILIELPVLAMLALAVRFSGRTVPVFFLIYAIITSVLTPFIHFALKFDVSPWIFFGADAQWMTLPRNQGMLLEASLMLLAIGVGWAWKRAASKPVSA